jgi:hypothetical protein
MNTTFWGPDGWQFLHTLTFIYPENPDSNEKLKMKNFMNSICFILPCKYCRLSFNKYMQSLPIDDYLDSRDLCIEWLYKIHNKVNKKLRIQGFCKHSNPDLADIKTRYKKITDNICEIMNKYRDDGKDDGKDKYKIKIAKNVINYICNLGANFLGSIVFNYQGYFSNCHTSIEKTKIVSVYNTFFNSIIPILCCYLENFCKDSKICISKYQNNFTKFSIRNILSENEPYTKLIKWFYNYHELCTMKLIYKTEKEYEDNFKKHIVISCDNPITKTVKSCRKAAFRKAAFRKSRAKSSFWKSRAKSSFWKSRAKTLKRL